MLSIKELDSFCKKNHKRIVITHVHESMTILNGIITDMR